jgi:hypothetical protein
MAQVGGWGGDPPTEVVIFKFLNIVSYKREERFKKL